MAGKRNEFWKVLVQIWNKGRWTNDALFNDVFHARFYIKHVIEIHPNEKLKLKHDGGERVYDYESRP